MAKESLATSAVKAAGRKAAEKGAIKAIEALPKGKQKKLARAIVFIASIVFLVLTVQKLRSNP